MQKTLSSVPSQSDPNIWLIAGGRDKKSSFHDVGPLLSQRVKSAYLMGETREKLRAAWSLFTPCRLVESLEDGVKQASEIAEDGDIILLSPASEDSSSFNGYQHRGEMFRQIVERLAGCSKERSTGNGLSAPKISKVMSR